MARATSRVPTKTMGRLSKGDLGRTSLALIAALALLPITPAPASALVKTVPDGTWMTNGTVFAIARAGNRVYLGGTFTQVQEAAGSGAVVTRDRLAALDATTGQVVSTWDPGANGTVYALAVSADGSKVYAGGDFTSVDGQSRIRLAAIDAVTGELIPGWDPAVGDRIRALASSGTRLYLGGAFLSVDGHDRHRLAAVSAVTGDLDGAWQPRANQTVRAVATSPDGARVYISGSFTTVSGSPRDHIAALDAGSGTVDPNWHPDPSYGIWGLAVSGTRVYGAGGGSGGKLPAFSASTGSTVWTKKTDGDVQAVALLGDKVYAGGHFLSMSGQPRQHLAAVDAESGALDPSWTASANSQWGVWSAFACGTKLYIGGDFTEVSGVAQLHYAQFSDDLEQVPSCLPGPSGGVPPHVKGLKAKVRGNKAIIRGQLLPPAPGDKVMLIFRAKGSPRTRVARKSDELNADSRFKKNFKIPSGSARCKVKVAYEGQRVGRKKFKC